MNAINHFLNDQSFAGIAMRTNGLVGLALAGLAVLAAIVLPIIVA